VEAQAEEAVEERWPSEWEVIYAGGLVNIRRRNNTGSEVVRAVPAGTVVLGFERGHWLKLFGMDGYMEIRLDSSGYLDGEVTELMRRREVAYLLADGDCDEENAYDIPDQAICRYAASRLEQAEDALWFNDGCQLDPTKHAGASATKEHGGDDEDADDGEDERHEGADDEARSANVAGEDKKGQAGRRLQSGDAPRGGHREATAEALDPAEQARRLTESESPRASESGGESWARYAKEKKLVRICSTAPYDALLPFPVQTHTSVTSVTGTTTQSATTTVSIFHEWGSPSLFCFAVFRAHTKEQDLVEEACRLSAGIFACDTTVTVSGEKVLVGKDYKNRDIWSWVNEVDDVTMGDIKNHPGETTNSWLNTQIFINSIKMLVNSGILWDHDWIIKGDPDAVIFPERVRKHIVASGSTGTVAFYKNCFHDGEWWLYGSIEVFSKEAMELYRDAGEEKCEMGMSWQGWGEDMYMAECMQKLGATAVHSGSLVADDYCAPRDCSDQEAAVFHPHKSKEKWRSCYKKSGGNGK